MKKLLSILLVLLVGITCLSGCQKTIELDEDDEIPEEVIEDIKENEPFITGGWTVKEDLDDSLLTDEEKDLFKKALEGFTGQGFTPVALLARQVVAGTNYMFLAKGTMVSANPEDELKIVVIYEDIDGNVSIIKVEDFELDDFTEAEEYEDDDLVGGWTINEEIKTQDNEVFSKALGGLVGAGYEVICEIGTQVVAGVNHMYLVKQTMATATPIVNLAVVTVYEDLNSECKLSTIHVVELADLVD